MIRFFYAVVVVLFLTSSLFSQWKPVSGTYGTSINCLFTKDKNIFAGTQAGAYLSTDNGVTWAGVNTGLYSPQVFSFTSVGNVIAAGTMSGVFITTDNGTTWSHPTNTGLTGSVYALVTDGIKIYAGTYSGGVFVSTDNAATWTALNTGLTKKDIQTMLLSGNNLFVGTATGGVFLSTDKGVTWNASSTGIPSTDVKALAKIDSTLFAGTNSSGVYVSTNNGGNWTRPGGAMKSWSMCVSEKNLFVGVYSGGVVLTKDKGTNWIPSSTGLTGYDLYVQCIAEIGPNLVVGIYGGTMFWRPKVEMTTSVRQQSTDTPGSFSLSQNYPNPFNPTTQIRFQLSRESHVTLSVYDALGRLVETLTDGMEQAGIHSVPFNGSSLASGMYFYQLSAEGNVSMKKMLLVK
ncbi:MAG: T9SS type A sorting domain-containing protein [Bacteroidota bacterium]